MILIAEVIFFSISFLSKNPWLNNSLPDKKFPPLAELTFWTKSPKAASAPWDKSITLPNCPLSSVTNDSKSPPFSVVNAFPNWLLIEEKSSPYSCLILSGKWIFAPLLLTAFMYSANPWYAPFVSSTTFIWFAKADDTLLISAEFEKKLNSSSGSKSLTVESSFL